MSQWNFIFSPCEDNEEFERECNLTNTSKQTNYCTTLEILLQVSGIADQVELQFI